MSTNQPIIKQPKYWLLTLSAITFLAFVYQQRFTLNQLASQSNIPVQGKTTKPTTISIPQLDIQAPPASISAKSAIAIDVDSSTILFQKDPQAKLLPASTTKIMTALVAMEEYNLDEIVTITDAHKSVGHKAELKPGEQISVKNLLYALLISSGNDAALALAQHHPKGYTHYVDLMNQKAQELSLKQTHYANVSGVDSPNHYTSVIDLALLTHYALKDPFFQSIVRTKKITVQSHDGTISHHLENTNQLLGETEGLLGVKTGWTENAGECLVTFTIRDNHPIIVAVLGSQDRFGESEALINWVYQNHTWQSITSP